MITNFDKETEPLNDLETQAAAIIAKFMLQAHAGEDKAVTSEAIGNGMANTYPQFRTSKGGVYLTGARIRKIINYLRTEGGCPFIVSSSKGYFVATDHQQIRDCIRSLRERAEAVKYVADCMERHHKQQYPDNYQSKMPIV